MTVPTGNNDLEVGLSPNLSYRIIIVSPAVRSHPIAAKFLMQSFPEFFFHAQFHVSSSLYDLRAPHGR